MEKGELMLMSGVFVLISVTLLLFFNNMSLTQQNTFLNHSLIVYEQKVQNLNKTLNNQAKSLSNLGKKINFLNKHYIDYNPSLKEVREFLQQDDTYKENYTSFFNCVGFSNMMVNHLRKHHIFGCVARLRMMGGSHCVVVVNTSDYGLVYIEPQGKNQIIFNLTPGQYYCKKAGWDCGLNEYYAKNYFITMITSCFGSERTTYKKHNLIKIW